MDRDQFVQAVRAMDERFEALGERARARPEAPLPAGEWNVRDALSHLAARSNPVGRVLARLREMESGNAAPPRDIHDENAEQVQGRAQLDVDALLDEIRQGHAQALADLAAVDDATLAREMQVAFRPEPITVAEYMRMAGPGHEGHHLGEIEQALNAGA